MGYGLLRDRVAVITGGARGIGLAIAHRFAAEGARVAVADIDVGASEEAAVQIDGTAVGVGVDVTDESSLQQLDRQVQDRYGRVDIVVPNAGILMLRHLLDTDPDDWRRVLDVNLTGAFLTSRVFGQRLVEQGEGGRIIVTSSLFGLRGGVENSAYSASKFGVLGMMESLAAELAPSGVLVNAVCPGQVDTPMLQKLFADRAELLGSTPEEQRQLLVDKIPLGRAAHTEEVADVFVFLASDLSRYMTGQALVVDGGWQVG